MIPSAQLRTAVLVALTAAIIPVLAIAFVLWPATVFAQREHLTLKSWTACPTIEGTNQMLSFPPPSDEVIE
jgi:hypothetical protein